MRVCLCAGASVAVLCPRESSCCESVGPRPPQGCVRVSRECWVGGLTAGPLRAPLSAGPPPRQGGHSESHGQLQSPLGGCRGRLSAVTWSALCGPHGAWSPSTGQCAPGPPCWPRDAPLVGDVAPAFVKLGDTDPPTLPVWAAGTPVSLSGRWPLLLTHGAVSGQLCPVPCACGPCPSGRPRAAAGRGSRAHLWRLRRSARACGSGRSWSCRS